MPFIVESLSSFEFASCGRPLRAEVQPWLGPGLAFAYQVVKSTVGGVAVIGASVALTNQLSAVVQGCGFGLPPVQPPSMRPLVSFAAAVPTVAFVPPHRQRALDADVDGLAAVRLVLDDLRRSSR